MHKLATGDQDRWALMFRAPCDESPTARSPVPTLTWAVTSLYFHSHIFPPKVLYPFLPLPNTTFLVLQICYAINLGKEIIEVQKAHDLVSECWQSLVECPLDALILRDGRETVRNGWQHSYPSTKCYFRCFVVSLFLRLYCSALRMKVEEKHCSLYSNVISSVSNILF